MRVLSRYGQHRKGFTVVELLVVIVVVAILATISVVAYNGITQQARESVTRDEAAKMGRRIQLASPNLRYPVSLAAASLPTSSGDFSYIYTQLSGGKDFCVTVLYKEKFSFSKKSESPVEDGPCDGHNGGESHCPTDTYVPINGYYCKGTIGALAEGNTNAVRLSSKTAPVPADAPGAFVGRQTTRDNFLSASFSVSPGQVYCASGWVATVDSTVTHSIGMEFVDGSGTKSWSRFGTWATASEALNKWVKLEGCITVPAGKVTARFWTQNDGANGGTAAPGWYQTAITFTKQS